jgi:hypothetical protein
MITLAREYVEWLGFQHRTGAEGEILVGRSCQETFPGE